jgi:hypothetical protein
MFRRADGGRSAGVSPAFLNPPSSYSAELELVQPALQRHHSVMWSAGACSRFLSRSLPRLFRGNARYLAESNTSQPPPTVPSSSFAQRPSAISLQFYSTHLPSRIHSNSLKTNEGRHRYPSQNRERNFPAFGPPRGEKFHSTFFTKPVGSKLARGSTCRKRDQDG